MQFDWDDLRVFLAIRRQGTLSAAARELHVSQPTVGRRIRHLEEILQARLFERLPEGYLPTAAGAELLPLAEDMERTALAVSRRQASFADQIRGTVRLSVFEETARFLSSHLEYLHQRLPEVELELSVAHQAANLSRREADLLIRECLPDSPGLVSRRLGQCAYAVYGAYAYIKHHPQALGEERYSACEWVGSNDEHMYFSGQKWLRERLGERLPAVRMNNAVIMHDAIRNGAGLGVLPCFAGDTDPVLQQLTAPLETISSTLYLLVHQDMRRSPAVRASMDALIDLYAQHTALLGGSAIPVVAVAGGR